MVHVRQVFFSFTHVLHAENHKQSLTNNKNNTR